MENYEGSVRPSTSYESMLVGVMEVVYFEVVVVLAVEDFLENFAMDFKKGDGSVIIEIVLG